MDFNASFTADAVQVAPDTASNASTVWYVAGCPFSISSKPFTLEVPFIALLT